MKEKYFSATKILIVLMILFTGGIFTGGFIYFKNNISEIMPSENMDIFLERKDICTILLNDNDILAGGATGLFILKEDKVNNEGNTDYKVSEIGNLRYVRDLVFYNEQVLIAYDEGILVLNDEKLSEFEGAQYLPDKRVNTLFVDSKGLLWAGTWGGAVVFDGNSVKKTYTAKDGIAASMVNKIFEDPYGNIWLGSYVAPRGGISIIDNVKTSEIFTFTVEKGLLHSNINDIILTDESVVLVGGGLYTRGGITEFSYNGEEWFISGYVEKSDGLAGEKVRSMMLDSKNNLWLGSEYDGLAVFYNNDKWNNIKILTAKDGLPNDEIKVIKEDKNGNIWIGTLKGLVKIKKGELK